MGAEEEERAWEERACEERVWEARVREAGQYDGRLGSEFSTGSASVNAPLPLPLPLRAPEVPGTTEALVWAWAGASRRTGAWAARGKAICVGKEQRGHRDFARVRLRERGCGRGRGHCCRH